MENQTLSIEERLSRLEALLERLVAATPAANNTSTVAAAAIPEPEANFNLSAIFDDRNGNPTPRLSILLQESINAASNQVANNRTIDRVIIDPTRIPSVI